MKNTINFKIKGTTFDNRQGYIAYLNKHADAFLVYSREKNNPHDKNAIAIAGYVPNGKYVPVGYVPKEIASEIAPLIDKGYRIYTHGYKIVGGHGYKYGIEVSISLYMPRKNVAYAKAK